MKEFEYKIYGRDGSYIATQTDVINEYPSFSWDVNSGLGSLRLQYARSWKDTYDCADLIVGNEIKVYLKPQGTLIYSGKINKIDFNADYITVEYVGYVSEFSQRILEDSDGDTGLQVNSADPQDILKDLIDLYNGRIIYNNSIDAVGMDVSAIFNGQTIAGAIDHLMEFIPNDWYWYVGPDNVFYFKKKSSTFDHLLTIGSQLINVQPYTRLDNVVNDVIVIGGTPDGGEKIYQRFQDKGSINAYGQRTQVINDGRLLDETSIEFLASAEMSPDPEIGWTADVLNYSIESIKPGDVIKIKDPEGGNDSIMWGEVNWGESYWLCRPNYVFNQPMIVRRIDYQGDRITIDVSDKLPQFSKDLENVKRNIEKFQNTNIPVRTN